MGFSACVLSSKRLRLDVFAALICAQVTDYSNEPGDRCSHLAGYVKHRFDNGSKPLYLPLVQAWLQGYPRCICRKRTELTDTTALQQRSEGPTRWKRSQPSPSAAGSQRVEGGTALPFCVAILNMLCWSVGYQRVRVVGASETAAPSIPPSSGFLVRTREQTLRVPLMLLYRRCQCHGELVFP